MQLSDWREAPDLDTAPSVLRRLLSLRERASAESTFESDGGGGGGVCITRCAWAAARVTAAALRRCRATRASRRSRGERRPPPWLRQPEHKAHCHRQRGSARRLTSPTNEAQGVRPRRMMALWWWWWWWWRWWWWCCCCCCSPSGSPPATFGSRVDAYPSRAVGEP